MFQPGESTGREEPSAAPHRFAFGPFLLHSELDIPELHGFAASATAGPDLIAVDIVLGAVPASLPGAIAYDSVCQVGPRDYLLHIAGVAGFHVSGGQRVDVQLAHNAPLADVSTYLLGSVFGALCHQNGLLPLHASAVASGGRVTAFLGDSGAGKSTLAACLQGRGYRIVSDDICVLQEDAQSGRMRVVPVAGWLKLWRASLNHLGEPADERHRVYSADDKYRLYLETAAADRPALSSLVFLERASSQDEIPRLEPLPAHETITRMMQLTYLSYITELTRNHVRAFRQCAKVLADAKGFRLVVPWGFEQMDGVLDLLERELLPPTTPR